MAGMYILKVDSREEAEELGKRESVGETGFNILKTTVRKGISQEWLMFFD